MNKICTWLLFKLMNRGNTKRKNGSTTDFMQKQIENELFTLSTSIESADMNQTNAETEEAKQMNLGRSKFNLDAKIGIEYLIENHLLSRDPRDVARFLYNSKGLNKTAIGDYLGERESFNESVLKEFVALQDFTHLLLVQALRAFLWSFRLPGEAQKIDRMLQYFAQHYYYLNPNSFKNSDTSYVLSFSIVMLNTTLHNQSIKEKTTLKQFVSMNRGIDNGDDLPTELLKSIYESIRQEPLQFPEDDENDLVNPFHKADKIGWLWKQQSGNLKSWNRRWFILNYNCLYYFKYETDKKPRGIILLENASLREVSEGSKFYCFELFATKKNEFIKACKIDSKYGTIQSKHSVYRMSAATKEDKQDWTKLLTESILRNVISVISKRKDEQRAQQ